MTSYRKLCSFSDDETHFLDSATIFTSKMVLPYFLRENIVAILQSFLHEVIILEPPFLPFYPQCMGDDTGAGGGGVLQGTENGECRNLGTAFHIS